MKFETILKCHKWYLCQISRTNHAIINFVYTNARKRFVIFTCGYFKLSLNTTALSQSNCSNFSCSRIIKDLCWGSFLFPTYSWVTRIFLWLTVWHKSHRMWKTFLLGCWKNKVVVTSPYICWIDFLRITSGTKGNTLIWSFEPNLETESGIEAGILEEKRVTSHLWIRFVACWAPFVVYCSFLVKWQEFMWGNFSGFWVESQCKHVVVIALFW